MASFRILFMQRSEENMKKILNERVLGGTSEKVYELFRKNPPEFSSFEEFMSSVTGSL